MSSGSKQQQQPTVTTTNVNQTSLPEYVRPYYEDSLTRAQGISQRGYEPYQGPRIADFSTQTQQSIDAAGGLAGAWQPYMANAGAGLAQAGGLYSQAANKNFTPGAFNGGQWNTGIAQQYMDPFIHAVLNNQLARNDLDFTRQQQARDSSAIMQGAFGGARHGIESAVANDLNNLTRQGVMSKGLSDAFGQAFQGFNADRNAGLNAAQMGEQSRQFGANFDMSALLQGAQGLSSIAKQSADLGAAGQNMGLANIEALRRAGALVDTQNQNRLNLAYDDFVNQRDWERQQLNWMTGVLRGVPTTPNSNVTQATMQSPANQALGLATGAAGLMQAFGKAA